MTKLKISIAALTLVLPIAGCTGIPIPAGANNNTEANNTAAIVGRIVSSDSTSKALLTAQGTCPEVLVSLSGSPVSIDFDDNCQFVIDGIQPSPLVEIRVELVDFGVAGTAEISDVLENEVIEIVVEVSDGALTISIVRRTLPESSDVLPPIVDGDDVSIQLPAGVFDQGLVVNGNDFTLVGEAGADCSDQTGWTVITGDVLVDGKDAAFRNILFVGNVTVHGNDAKFINVCFDGELIVFGNDADAGDDDDGGGGGDDDDNGDDDDDEGDDDD